MTGDPKSTPALAHLVRAREMELRRLEEQYVDKQRLCLREQENLTTLRALRDAAGLGDAHTHVIQHVNRLGYRRSLDHVIRLHAEALQLRKADCAMAKNLLRTKTVLCDLLRRECERRERCVLQVRQRHMQRSQDEDAVCMWIRKRKENLVLCL